MVVVDGIHGSALDYTWILLPSHPWRRLPVFLMISMKEHNDTTLSTLHPGLSPPFAKHPGRLLTCAPASIDTASAHVCAALAGSASAASGGEAQASVPRLACCPAPPAKKTVAVPLTSKVPKRHRT